ncbi:MAG: hypothetical protein BWY70_01183 [Bacteroidetes bacterium ADurb.Bin408]|nr:MAG: hypothetical protein BWY70_01183 [Bacteroidetes bacterium ADurb.Bin408]
MPAHNAISYTGDTVLLAMGNGSYSDGIYKFNTSTQTYTVSEWLPFCTFVRYCPGNSTYYAGSRYNGLLSSPDGHTWTMEYFIDNMNVVGFDVTGNLFTGFHGALPTFEGVAIYGTTANDFTFLNNNLPSKNINRYRINIILSSITIFACTDTGVYFCNNYLTSAPEGYYSGQNIHIFPNPASDFIQITGIDNAWVDIFNINGQKIKTIYLPLSSAIDISAFAPGVYALSFTSTQFICRKN